GAAVEENVEAPAKAEEAAPKKAAAEKPAEAKPATAKTKSAKATPVAGAIMADKKVDPSTVKPSGSNNRIMKQDVLQALDNPGRAAVLFSRSERSEKMSNLRKTISRRLVEAKNSTAMLTTFNEVDMSAIMDIRKKYKDKFKEVHGVGLGF